jgi:MerR family transcriptional regulator, light-induced transcriptional regulator
VAGWMTDRLAKLQPLRFRGKPQPGASNEGDSPPECAPDVMGFVSRIPSEMLKLRQQTLDLGGRMPGMGGGSGVSGPHLVSTNSGEDLQLMRIVELEIIPRLMLMHSASPGLPRPPSPALAITLEHVETLAHLSVEGDAGVASSYVQALIDAGAELEPVFLDLLAPCARQLGEMWEEDEYDFSQVTVGLWRLQQVLYEQSRRFNLGAHPEGECHCALMAAVPGSQHTFGVTLAAEFFSRAGWDVVCEPKTNWNELNRILQARWVDMIGLSIGTVESLPEVASAILEMRQASVNPGIFVLVGGPMAPVVSDLSGRCGADAMALDAVSAVNMASRWVGERRQA